MADIRSKVGDRTSYVSRTDEGTGQWSVVSGHQSLVSDGQWSVVSGQ